MSTYTPPSPRPTAGGIFTYREGATSDPSRGLYDTWAGALAAAQQVRPSTLFIDPVGGPGTVPAGTWDIDNIRIYGGSGSGVALMVSDGAKLTGTNITFDAITLNQNGLTPFITISGNDAGFISFDRGSAIQTTSYPAIEVLDTAFVIIYLRYFGFLYGVAGPVVTTSVDAVTWIFADIATAIYDNALDGDGGYLVDDVTGIAVLNRNLNISHTHTATNIVFTYG